MGEDFLSVTLCISFNCRCDVNWNYFTGTVRFRFRERLIWPIIHSSQIDGIRGISVVPAFLELRLSSDAPILRVHIKDERRAGRSTRVSVPAQHGAPASFDTADYCDSTRHSRPALYCRYCCFDLDYELPSVQCCFDLDYDLPAVPQFIRLSIHLTVAHLAKPRRRASCRTWILMNSLIQLTTMI